MAASPLRQIDSLTGIRGFASLWVFFHHLPSVQRLETVLPVWLRTFADKGWLGVDLFFILSGFVISLVHQAEFSRFPSPTWKRFLLLRLARIYPAHFVTTALLIPIYLAAHFLLHYNSPKDSFAWSKLALSLTLFNGWGFPNSEGWNIPSWSVSSEWFAYLSFPFLAPVLGRIRSIGAAAAGIAAIFGLLYALAFLCNNGAKFMLDWEFTTVRVTSEFAIGCLLFNMHKALPRSTAADWLAAAAFAAICLLPFLAPRTIFDGLYLAAFVVLILSLSIGQGPVTSFMGSPVLIYLGKVSYSLYLIHGVVLILANQLTKLLPQAPSPALQWTVVAACVGLSIALADRIFHWVEDPFRHWAKRRIDAVTGAPVRL